MECSRSARTILNVTALAWAIPLAQTENKVALLGKQEPRSLEVSVENYKGEAMLSGFVKDSLAVRS